MRLRKECEHGHFDAHSWRKDSSTYETHGSCPGGEFLPEGALVIEKEAALQIIADQEWTVQERQGRHLNGEWHYLTESEINVLLDALASQVGESER